MSAPREVITIPRPVVAHVYREAELTAYTATIRDA